MRLATDMSLHRRDVPVVPLLAPFVPDGVQAGGTEWDRRFGRWNDVAQEHHELVDVDDADLVVVPTDWYWVRGASWASRPDRDLARRLSALQDLARAADKPLAVFFTGDRSCDRLPIEGAHVFREGAFRSRLGPRDHATPAFAEDLVQAYLDGQPPVRVPSERPVIGFCGLATTSGGWRSIGRRLAFDIAVGARERRRDPSPKIGETYRAQALESLDRSPLVDTNFVVRGESVFFRDAATTDLVDIRREYVDNLAACDYVLCIRGSGNYSYRLYEALSMGRIPVIIDTDLALPCREVVPWRELCVWVPQRERDQIDRHVAEYHARHLDELPARQARARELWLQHLAPESFFAQLDRWMETE